MNKKYLAVVVSTLLVGFAAFVCGQVPWQASGGANEPRAAALSGPEGEFGPVMERVLPAETNARAEILDLETGRAVPQEPFDDQNFRADVIMAWIRSNGLDISGSVWPGGAACVTYDMTVIPVEGKCWEKTTAEEILGNPSLAASGHSPRRQLVLGDNRPDTYIFRTGEGTVGMLRLVGLSEQGIQIRYKLINPAKSLSVVLR